MSATVSLQQKLRTDTESQLSRFQQQLRGELERFRSETESEVKKQWVFLPSSTMCSLGVMSGCASQLRAAGEASQASLQAAVERTVQRAVREEVAPRLQAMVEELRGSVEAYVASFRVNSGELREVREMVEEMQMHWAADLPSAIALADRLLGRTDSPITVIPDGVSVIVKK